MSMSALKTLPIYNIGRSIISGRHVSPKYIYLIGQGYASHPYKQKAIVRGVNKSRYIYVHIKIW